MLQERDMEEERDLEEECTSATAVSIMSQHELRQSGENRRAEDGVNYIVDGLSSTEPSSIRLSR
jgi:hypothetical protein